MSSTTSDHKVSSTVWVYGFVEIDKFQYFSIELPDLLKRRRTDDFRMMESKFIQPNLLEADYNLYFCKAVAIDGVVYVIGGGNPLRTPPRIPQPYIQCLDTRENIGWIKKKIQRARFSPRVADLEGKIYIFGGDGLNKPSSEVFDTINETAELLPDGFSSDMQLVGVDRNLKRIVFFSDDTFDIVYFNADNNTWTHEEMPEEEEYPRSELLRSVINRLCVVVGTTIYWLSYTKEMMAYDFAKCEYYESEILANLPGSSLQGRFKGLKPEYIDSEFLLHVKGDYFCLVSLDGGIYEPRCSFLYFTILRVSRRTTTGRLTVSVLDTDKYALDGVRFSLREALRLSVSPSMLMTDDAEQVPDDSVMLEESLDSPSLVHSTISHVFEGYKFILDFPVSIWVYGCFNEYICWFPIELRESDVTRELKRRRIHDDLSSHSTGDDKELKIIDPIEVDYAIDGAAFATVDGIIYTVGGMEPYISNECGRWLRQPYIRCFDTTKKTGSGKQYEMNKGRADAQVAELDGKIYIFGGDDDTTNGSARQSSEVFDPVTGNVEMLPDGYDKNYKLLGVDRDSKRIMFWAAKREWDRLVEKKLAHGDFCPMIFYNTEENTWTTNETNNTKLSIGHYIMLGFNTDKYVILGTTIYCVSDYAFWSYDFNKHEFRHSGNLIDAIGYYIRWGSLSPWLFHMYEDIFCMVTMRWDFDAICKNGEVFCTMLRICSSKTEVDKLNLDVLDTYTYVFRNGSEFSQMGALRVMKQREDILSHRRIEGILRVLTMSVAITCIFSQLFYLRENVESVPYIITISVKR